MKSYKELIQETLNQRAIIDNRQAVDVADVNKSVLIAFNQACVYMRDLHNWVWNYKEETYINNLGQDSYPMPYGIVHGMVYQKGSTGAKCPLMYAATLTATQGCPTQWTHDWANEEIKIAPAVSSDCDNISTMVVQYHDKNIACLGARTDGNLLKEFTLSESTDNQFLNVPEYIYEAYAKCVVLKARVFLNEGAQPTVFEAQQREFNEAYNGLMMFAQTPYYEAQRIEM